MQRARPLPLGAALARRSRSASLTMPTSRPSRPVTGSRRCAGPASGRLAWVMVASARRPAIRRTMISRARIWACMRSPPDAGSRRRKLHDAAVLSRSAARMARAGRRRLDPAQATPRPAPRPTRGADPRPDGPSERFRMRPVRSDRMTIRRTPGALPVGGRHPSCIEAGDAAATMWRVPGGRGAARAPAAEERIPERRRGTLRKTAGLISLRQGCSVKKAGQSGNAGGDKDRKL